MTPWTGPSGELSDRIAAWIDASLADLPLPEPWEQLALAIHAFQRAADPVLASLGDPPTKWSEIPAVPVGVFKELPVGTVRPGRLVFRTSGTTGTGRGEHHLRSSALYDRGAVGWFRRWLGRAAPGRVVALLDDPSDAPDSSLSHMVAAFPGTHRWHVHRGRLDAASASGDVLAAGTPVFLASTAFAAAEWLETAPPRAPAGSIAMVTGGFKGRIHRLEEPELVRSLEALGFDVVLEYGMTELSSQLWAFPGEAYAPPPWLRVRAVDPRESGLLPAGEVGLLRYWDLANLDGTLAIETMDLGAVDERGQVTLHGRLSGAPPRGCSLTVEEAWARRGR
jgi:hypothetical protein